MNTHEPGLAPRTLAGIPCVRGCGRIAPVDIDEVTGTGGDPALLPVLVGRRAWIPVPDIDDAVDVDGYPVGGEPDLADLDPGGLICPACSTDAEFDAYYQRLDEADDEVTALIAQTMRDERADEVLGPPADRGD